MNCCIKKVYIYIQLNDLFFELQHMMIQKKKKKKNSTNFCNVSNVYFIIELINEFRN